MRIHERVRSRVSFKTMNLLKTGEYPKGQTFDLVIVRNVFIYFEPEDIRKVSESLSQHLHSNGYFIVGLSESLNSLGVSLNHIGRSVYSKSETQNIQENPVANAVERTPRPGDVDQVSPLRPIVPEQAAVDLVEVSRGPIRVLNVDDSPTVLKILNKIFSSSKDFKVVGQAKNGAEAIEMSQSLDFDLMTLDIHMPEIDGIEYLKRRNKKNHPPIIMVSSVDRSNKDIALKALELGAVDYVEKPSMENLNKVSEELMSKALFASRNLSDASGIDLGLVKSMAKSDFISKPDQNLTVVFAGISQISKASTLLQQMSKPQPPILIYLDAPEDLVEDMTLKLSQLGHQARELKEGVGIHPNRVYVSAHLERVLAMTNDRYTSMIVIKDLDATASKKIAETKAMVCVEEGVNMAMLPPQCQVVPFTSLAYESDRTHMDENKKESAA